MNCTTCNDLFFDQKASERVKKLREEVVHAKPILCSERAKLITEAYRQTEDMPASIRRALSLKKILEEMTLIIWDGELIVGNHGSNGRRSAPVFPEYATKWIEEELKGSLETREQDTFIVPQSVKDDLKEAFKYWENKTIFDQYRALLPDEAKRARDEYMFSRDLFERNGYGHTAYDIPKLLKVGILGIRKEAESRMRELDFTTAQGLNSKVFYEGVIICCDAVSLYIKRFASKALDMAKQEKNEKRAKELMQISENCNNISTKPANTLWEALQLVEFMQLVIQIETSGDSVSPGRMDQYLIDLYRNDVKSGRLNVEQAQELLDCFWIKLNEIVKVQDTESIYIHPGFPMTPNLTIGGQTPQGEDAVNELSYLMLNSQEHIRLTNPQFTVRVCDKTPERFKLRLVDIIKLGTGMPALFGDNACIAAIKRSFPDMPIERARDYRIVGCVELSPRGFQGRVNGGQLNVARVVDLALNNGVDRLTGKQIGPVTGCPEEFKTFGELMEAVNKQMEYFVNLQVINAATVDMIQREKTPHLFLSSLIEGCLEKGKDMTSGGSLWGATPILHVGLATAANSLAAVKKLVFEDKKLNLKEIKEAQDDNFKSAKSKEIQELLLRAPKYGNDDEFADDVMKETTDNFFDIIESFRDIDGRKYTSMILTLGGTVPHGWKTGATADGRLEKTPVSDSMSPTNGSDVNGPTAVLMSASKIDQVRVLEGTILNLKFSKGLLETDEAKKQFVNLYSTYLEDLNGQEVQFNIVSSEDLRKAQENPDEYRDLIIRVAGYSARFVELSKELQDDIITRTELEL